MSLEDVKLSRVIDEALTERARLMADGTLSAKDIAAAFEAVVRQVWPKGRAEPWEYTCRHCLDTGGELFTCRKGARCQGTSTRTDGPHEKPGKYQRLCKQHPDSDETHEYRMPCLACHQGSRFREAPKGGFDPLGAAAQMPKKPSRFGGR